MFRINDFKTFANLTVCEILIFALREMFAKTNQKCEAQSLLFFLIGWIVQGVPKKHGNSVTNWISSLL